MEEKQESSNAIMKNKNWAIQLPPHIAPVIFSKLLIYNLPICRLVCKSWNRLVLDYASCPNPLSNVVVYSTVGKDPNSEKIHCFDIDTLRFVASCKFDGPDVHHIVVHNYCNGLLFIEKSGPNIDCEGIFNPMTNEFFHTPKLDLPYTFHGFGFSPKTNQYKLFRSRLNFNMRVLRFGGNHNQWTSISLPPSVALLSHGAYRDGVVYWLAKEELNEYIIYALDVETEKFEATAVLEVGPFPHRAKLQPFNDTIYALVFVFKPAQIQVWRMRGKYSWVRQFIVPGEFTSEAIIAKASKDGKISLRIMNDLFWLDKSGRKIERKGSLPRFKRQFMGTCHIESLHFGSLPNILATRQLGSAQVPSQLFHRD